MDRAVEIVARKRLERFPEAWRAELDELPENEREVALSLIAYLDARPVDELASDRRPVLDEREGR